MDFNAARAALPGLTRGLFGELATITPMRKGEMKSMIDPGRPVLSGVPARFDFNPLETEIGGGGARGDKMRLAGETASVSFERAALAWQPISGDRVSRQVPGGTETFEIVRAGRDGGPSIIFYLSKV